MAYNNERLREPRGDFRFREPEHELPSDNDWGEPDPSYWVKKEHREEERRRMLHYLRNPPPAHQNENSNSEDQRSSIDSEDGDKGSGVDEMNVGISSPVGSNDDKPPIREELDERTQLSIQKVYNNDMLMETIISNLNKLSDRGLVERSSSRLFTLSRKAPYRFFERDDHLQIHFTTFDDMATIEYGPIARVAPMLTLNTRRFDKMNSMMTIALQRVLQNIASRFARKVRKITLGGTSEFHSARGVPEHHLILTFDFLLYLLERFTSVSALHLVNCGIEDGALDLCETDLWGTAMARMRLIELRTVWADTRSRLPELLVAPARNLEQFTLTRFKCTRMGTALLNQLRLTNCRLRDLQLVLDEDTAEDEMEMFCMLKEFASRTESLRITVDEIGDGSQLSPKCFAILPLLRGIPNLTELKVNVQPQTAAQFQALITLFRDLEMLISLRTLHIEGFMDGYWLEADTIYNLAEAFQRGLTYRVMTLEDVSFANFPRVTDDNEDGFQEEEKEMAYNHLWDAMALSIGCAQRIRRFALRSVRLEDAHLRKMYNAISKTAEEVYLKNIRGVLMKSVLPLVNGEFPRLKKLEAEIAVLPFVLQYLAEVQKTPFLQHAKLVLSQRISEEHETTKMLRAMFSTVLLDQDCPRGPLKQFIEVHNRIPGAAPLVPTATVHQEGRPVRPFDYRTAGYGAQQRTRSQPRNLYGEWDD